MSLHVTLDPISMRCSLLHWARTLDVPSTERTHSYLMSRYTIQKLCSNYRHTEQCDVAHVEPCRWRYPSLAMHWPSLELLSLSCVTIYVILGIIFQWHKNLRRRAILRKKSVTKRGGIIVRARTRQTGIHAYYDWDVPIGFSGPARYEIAATVGTPNGMHNFHTLLQNPR